MQIVTFRWVSIVDGDLQRFDCDCDCNWKWIFHRMEYDCMWSRGTNTHYTISIWISYHFRPSMHFTAVNAFIVRSRVSVYLCVCVCYCAANIFDRFACFFYYPNWKIFQVCCCTLRLFSNRYCCDFFFHLISIFLAMPHRFGKEKVSINNGN